MLALQSNIGPGQNTLAYSYVTIKRLMVKFFAKFLAAKKKISAKFFSTVKLKCDTAAPSCQTTFGRHDTCALTYKNMMSS
jgi:hypothetical protein